MPGIEEDNIKVNLERDAFTLQYDPARVGLEEMYEAIRELGYSPGLSPPALDTAQNGESPELSPVDTALARAQNEGKHLLVDFSAQWCIACRMLEEQVLGDAAVQAALSNYIFVEVDTDEYANVASKYQVVGMPTLIVLDGAGAELFRSVGQIEVRDLEQKLKELAGKELAGK